MEKLRGSAGRWMVRVAGVASVLALTACGGGGGGGGGELPAATGTLRMSMTDAPSCYDSVLVTVAKVRVHTNSSAGDPDGGWQEIVPPGGPVQVDLLNLTNGQIADLGSAAVPAGTYSQVRLVLAENTQANPLANAVKPVGGQLVPLTTPSGQQSGLKLKGDFEVEAGSVKDMLLDFDACKSVVLAGNSGKYLLKPVVRLSPKPATSISGYVTTTMTPGATTVSAQQGGSVVRSTVPDATGKFTLAYLPSGTYTVVITSDHRATGVIDSVPVGTSTVTLNGTATAIVLPTSVMNTVTGTVTATSTSTTGTGTASMAVDDATVTAYQSVGSSTVQVAARKVDDGNAYVLRLPVAAPVRAPFATGGWTFTSDAAAAGKYTLKASAEGRAQLSKTVDVSGGAATANFSY